MSFDRVDRELLFVKPAIHVERAACGTLCRLRSATAHWWRLPLPLVAGGAVIVLLCLAA